MYKFSLGAAIIAKNEAENIKNCILSVLPFCKQVVLIDTGSNDKTPILATQLGAEVYFHEWNNSFSEARNFAIKHIRTDWIISIDADEVLDFKSFDKFMNKNSFLLSSNQIGGISVILNNFLDKQLQTSSQHRFTRIFQRNDKFLFERSIHEQISESIVNAGFSILDSDITIDHFGYIDHNKEKIERNRQLLQTNISSKNVNDFDYYHLANTEFAASNIDSALSIFISLKFSNSLTEEQKNICKIKIGQIYLQKSDYKQVISTLDFQINDVNLEGLRQSILAATYLILKNYKMAKEYYEKYEINNSSLVDKNIIKKALNFLNNPKKMPN